jgi:dTDP-4-amino-4,6-dideoxygalactose transaminase
LFVDSENPEHRFGVMLEGIPYDAKFVFERIGYNLEPSEIGAAFGLVQLGRLQSNIDARVANFDAHLAFFSDYADWFTLPRQCEDSRTGWLALPLILRDEAPFTRRQLQTYLEGCGIQTRTVFTGNILRQPAYRDIVRREASGGYPNADRVMRSGMLVACHHGLSETDLSYVHDRFRDFAGQW